MGLESDTLDALDAHLTAIEQEEDVTVVAAWVMGSYARNVESAGSDIDLNFVYVQPVTRYASLTRYRASLRSNGDALAGTVPTAAQMDTEVELQGWDAKRFLELLGGRDDGNNPSVIESLCSPLAIRSHPVLDDLQTYVSKRFNVIEMYNHYRGLVTRNWRKYIEDDSEPTVKRMLYILRGILYARYVRDTHELATLDIPQFVEDAPDSVFEGLARDDMRSLIERKRAGRGDERIDKADYRDAIDAFLDDDLDYQQHVRDDHMNSDDLDEFMSRLLADTTE